MFEDPENKNDNKTVFYGRPDGLGNRYEELLLLSNYAVKNNIYFKYIWNNTGKWKYSNKFLAKNIEIVEKDYVKEWPTKNFESTKLWREYISTNDISHNKNVVLNLKYPKIKDNYIGVLVRGSDRIVDDIESLPPGFQSSDDVETSIELTLKYLSSQKNLSPIVIFSEDKNLKKYVSEKLNNYKQISLPKIEYLEQAYEDFVYLLSATEIILCSRFSSFALSAGMISNTRVVKFFSYSHPLLNRWKNEYLNFPVQNNQDQDLFSDYPKFSKNEKIISIGNNFKKSYKTTEQLVDKVVLLISYNKSKYIGFEENFKFIKKKIRIDMFNMSIFISDLKEIVEILFKSKNRKKILKEKISYIIKTIKILGFKTYFVKSYFSNVRKLPYFLYIDIDNFIVNEKKYFNDEYFKGGVIYFENYENKKTLIKEIINRTNQFTLHFEHDIDDNKSFGYVSLIKNE